MGDFLLHWLKKERLLMIEQMNDVVFKWLGKLLIFTTAFLVSIIFLQVVLRYVFNFSIAEIDELSRYVFVWIIFLGISYGFREKAHLGVVYFIELMSPKRRKVFLICIELLIIVFFLVITIAGFQMVQFTMAQKSSTLLIPMGYVYLAIPVGAILCLITMVERLKVSIES
jgi:TRAP-type C4-dicarboxylate transport system permease small subunit